MTKLIARTDHGNVEGRTLAAGGALFAGVPYAAPPVGMRRFLPPETCAPWDGVLPCTSFGAACPQPRASSDIMKAFEATARHSEDCLTLNVWTPSVDDQSRPVVVWIHGGGFQTGSADSPLYGGHAFIESDCVLVTINYRLNAFGFLFLDDLIPADTPSSNLGLLDQVAALTWVRDNIAAFGGDPGLVTVAGESAGAMSIGCLMAMPRAEGLFHRAILQSGADRHVISTDGAAQITAHVLRVLNISNNDLPALWDIPAGRLLETVSTLTPSVVAELLGDEFSTAMPFQPVVGGLVLPRAPALPISDGHATQVDVMIGTCTDELRLVSWGMYPNPADRPTDPAIQRELERRGTTLAAAVDTMSTAAPHDTLLDHLSALETDYRYTVPAIDLANAHYGADRGTWLYRFNWNSPVRDGQLRACHGVDVPFVFRSLDTAPELIGDNPPASLAHAVHEAWTAFARTGDPTCDSLGYWPPYSPDTGAVKIIDIEPSIEDCRTTPALNIWRSSQPEA